MTKKATAETPGVSSTDQDYLPPELTIPEKGSISDALRSFADQIESMSAKPTSFTIALIWDLGDRYPMRGFMGAHPKYLDALMNFTALLYNRIRRTYNLDGPIPPKDDLN